MNTRNWLVIAALACAPFVAAGPAFAQDTAPRAGAHAGMHGRRGHFSPEMRLERMTAILGLDANQQQLVRQILETNRPRFQEIRQMTDVTARHAAMQTLRTQTHAQIDAVLTPDQRATLERMRSFRHEHGRGRGGRGARGGAPAGI